MAAPPAINAPRSRTMFRLPPESVRIIGVDTEHKEGEHPLWDARAFLPLDEALVLNIMAFGVRRPIDVMPDTDRVPLVGDGRRRILHAREANIRRVAVGMPPMEVMLIVHNVSGDVPDMMGIMVSGNEWALKDSVLGRAKKAAAMLRCGIAPERVATEFGVKVQTVEQWRTMAEAPAELHELVEQGSLSASALAIIAKKPLDEQAEIVAKVKGNGQHKAPASTDDPPSLQDQLLDAAGEHEPASGPDEPASGEEVKKKKRKKKKAGKKASVKEVMGARGKKFFKQFAADFADYLPPEFVLGMQFAIGAVKDEELPKGINTQVQGMRWVAGEIDDTQLAVGIAKQLKKMYKAD